MMADGQWTSRAFYANASYNRLLGCLREETAAILEARRQTLSESVWRRGQSDTWSKKPNKVSEFCATCRVSGLREIQ